MVSKRQLLQQKLVQAVLREKNVMESVDSSFLLHMFGSFQDENFLYFVLGLVTGGELFELMYGDKKGELGKNSAWKQSTFYKSFGPDDEKPVQGCSGIGVRPAVFYGACVIEAFNYLHNRRIVYRDLKPENGRIRNCCPYLSNLSVIVTLIILLVDSLAERKGILHRSGPRFFQSGAGQDLHGLRVSFLRWTSGDCC